MAHGIIAKKIGMTRLFNEDGSATPVTVLQAGPCPVVAVRSEETDGYVAAQLAWDAVPERKLSKAELGHLKASGVEGTYRRLVEIRDFDGVSAGDEITVARFELGSRVKVSGVTQGKGFQGGIKRHNFSRGPMSHGSHNKRAPGSIGASAWPARVMKGQKMPGQMGNKNATQLGLKVVKVDEERNLLMVKGSVPGHKNGYVVVVSV
ncbi:MAG: 50S ribosomal protein L3 [Thermoleophilia bacterium]|nr:50S ribosomal protein L3 [Thermoleophilia bacterium]